MSGDNVVSFRRRTVDGFGGCPVCSRVSGVMTVGHSHWLYCERHRSKWFAGCTLFRPARPETPAQWLANARLLADYREVTPSRWRWVSLSGEGEPDIAARIGS
jgi:hypothetical protein